MNIQEEIHLRKKNGFKVVSCVMCNHGQQQYFSDVIELTRTREKIFYFFANDYAVGEKQKFDTLKDLDFVDFSEYSRLEGIDVALHSEIHCRSPHVDERCFVGHGFPGKHTVWEERHLRSFNHYFMYGPKDREIIKFVTRNNPSIMNSISFWEVGYPKYDYQFNATDVQIDKVSKKIGLDPEKKTILFAPAWDPNGILRTQGREILNLFKTLDQYNFIIQLHPASLSAKKSEHYEFYTGGIDWKKEIRNQIGNDSKERSNLFFPGLNSINPLFKVSDLLVTDFSGVTQGFCLENKPIICIDCPQYFARTLEELGSDGDLSREHPLFNNGRHAAHLISGIHKLEEEVSYALDNPDQKMDDRMEVAKQLLYHPGKGTETFLETLKKILGIETEACA